jgi:AcrR family transcriptional regulator
MEPGPADRRQQRTREAIRKAFVKLATARRYDDFTVAELIEAAGIGRSTFYEHYRSKDDVLRALMDGMLAELAVAAAGTAEQRDLRGLVAHFWDNRRLGKAVFGPQLGPTIRRRLAELIEARQGASGRGGRSRASFAAAGQVGLLHAWLSGELAADVDEIADALTGAV